MGERRKRGRERLNFPEPSPFFSPPPPALACANNNHQPSVMPHPDSPFCTCTLLSGKRPSTYNASLCLGKNTHYTEEQQESWRRWETPTLAKARLIAVGFLLVKVSFRRLWRIPLLLRWNTDDGRRRKR